MTKEMTEILKDADQVNIGDKLKEFIERYEQLNFEKLKILERQKQIVAEVRLIGLHVGAFKQVIARRRENPDMVADRDSNISLYEEAISK